MELDRVARHVAWVEWQKSAGRSGAEPPPGFKDCANCGSRLACQDEDERRQLCGQCPYEDALEEGEELPASPGVRYFRAVLLNEYPPEYIGRVVERMRLRDLRDLQAVRVFQADQKEARRAAMMGMRL